MLCILWPLESLCNNQVRWCTWGDKISGDDTIIVASSRKSAPEWNDLYNLSASLYIKRNSSPPSSTVCCRYSSHTNVGIYIWLRNLLSIVCPQYSKEIKKNILHRNVVLSGRCVSVKFFTIITQFSTVRDKFVDRWLISLGVYHLQCIAAKVFLCVPSPEKLIVCYHKSLGNQKVLQKKVSRISRTLEDCSNPREEIYDAIVGKWCRECSVQCQ